MSKLGWAAVSASLLSQGCVSFAYSRFTPQRSDQGPAACSDVPPFADGVIALLAGIGGLTLDGLNRALSECGQYPNAPNCRPHLEFYLPALVAAASMAYGTTAYAVCEGKLKSGDWRPQAGKP